MTDKHPFCDGHHQLTKMQMSPLKIPAGYVDDPVALHRARAAGMRRAQQQGEVAIQSAGQSNLNSMAPHRPGVMAPVAKYSDIAVIEDDDIYFLGHPEDQPFSVTPKPPYFDDFKAACRQDQADRVRQIIAQNSCTPAMLHYGLVLALTAGSVDAARELLQHSAPIARRAPESILSAPLDRQRPLLNVLAAQGWTPSHDLFMRSIPNVELMQWFLSHGIDPNYGVKQGTPYKAGGPSNECADALEAAARAGSAEAIEILIAAGAKVAHGSPLHSAAGASPPAFVPYEKHALQPSDFDAGRIPAMPALVVHGADVNAKEETPHMTPAYPLVYAVQAGAIQRARWLLEHGADANLKGPYGSAAWYAANVGSEEMKALFQSHIGTE